MDDIDRTYWKLKRCTYDELIDKIYHGSKNRWIWRYIPGDKRATLYDEYHHICTENGWTVEEFLNSFYE